MSEFMNDELIEDAEIEGLAGRSRFGSFLRGSLLGILASGGVLLGLTLSQPLPGNLPGISQVQVETGSSDDASQVATVAQTGSGAAQTGAVTQSSTTASNDAPQPDASEGSTGATSQTSIAATPPVEGQTPGAEAETATIAQTESAASQAASAPASTDEATSAATSSETANSEQNETSTSATELAAVTPAPETTAAAEQPLPQINLSGPAFTVNASDFDVPDTAPILAIVLSDASNGSVKADSLGLWPFPVALGIAPDSPSAITLAEAARTARHEVLIELPFALSKDNVRDTQLHAGLDPDALQDLTFRNLAALPNALGVVASGQADMITDRVAMAAVVSPVTEHGFAWVDPMAGSGSVVASIASQSDLVHGAVNRVVPAGASAQQVLNGLKSAAFTARQRGNAIVRIDASEEAMSALLTFALENGDNTFRIAPVSAVLKRRSAQ